MLARTGDWIQTYSGRQFWPLDPRPEEIYIDDIAGALSKICRFGGHCKRFYSVAEHSVLVARAARPEHKFAALLHDASEAYLADVPRPVKPHLTGYSDIEDRLMSAIAERFKFEWPLPEEVKRIDSAILADEMEQIMAPPPADWFLPEPPAGIEIYGWDPGTAQAEFLREYRECMRRR